MKLGKFFVKINLRTEISDGTDRQLTTLEAAGELFQTERQTVIRFTEQVEEQPDVKTMITIKPKQVTIKRSGGVEMHQQFNTLKITETIYRHQFGSMRMETQTDAFLYKPLSNTSHAELSLDYRTKLAKEEERKHKLMLLIEEDKS